MAAGHDADLILVNGNPLDDVCVLAQPGGRSVRLVIKEGLLAKAPASLSGINKLLSTVSR